MNVAGYVVAVALTLVGAGSALLGFVFTIAGAANTRPEDEPVIRAALWGFGLGGVVCAAAAFALIALARPWWAAGVGSVPAVASVVVLCYALAASG